MSNQNNDMEVDGINPSQVDSDYMIALLAQQQELEMSGNPIMNANDIANFTKSFREYQEKSKNVNASGEGNSGCENDEEIARLMQENYIREQEMYNMLGRNQQSAYPASQNNPNKINENLKDYHTSELQKQYHERYVKEKLSHEYFRNKLKSDEALPIRKQLRDFYIDFEQKTKSVFTNPEEQSQYLREFLNVG